MLEFVTELNNEKTEFLKCLELSKEKEELIRLYSNVLFESLKEPRLIDYLAECEISDWRSKIIYFITKSQHNKQNDKFYAEEIKRKYLKSIGKLNGVKKAVFFNRLFSKKSFTKSGEEILNSYPNEQEYNATISWESKINTYPQENTAFIKDKKERLKTILKRTYEIDKILTDSEVIKTIDKVFNEEGEKIPTFFGLENCHGAFSEEVSKTIAKTITPTTLILIGAIYLDENKPTNLENAIRKFLKIEKEKRQLLKRII